ncbi:MAG: hypothetical protein LBJ59_07565 [Zoogloeaceae bacterium]|jgi:hypothetical protein|nr:hypothetical protein [Zoogloeaceae bacterium]
MSNTHFRRSPYFAWWYSAASNGEDAHCCNCTFAFEHPARGGLACRLSKYKSGVSPHSCCINWLDTVTNSSPLDEIRALNLKARLAAADGYAKGRA